MSYILYSLKCLGVARGLKKGILKNLIYLALVNSSVPMGFLKNSDSLGLAISNIYNLLYI